jgi:CBS domain-containing protein
VSVEIIDFLRHFPPFDGLEPDGLEDVARAIEVRAYPAGTNVLVEDGEPTKCFYVIRDGSMELVHEDEVIDILEPGESFGHPSLLTGLAPSFTVRAHEDSTCYLVPREQALAVLGRPQGAGFVASTLRDRLTRTGHTVHALPQLGTVRVADLIERPPQFCEPGTTIRRAATVMTEHGASAILVPDGRRLTILTDADLRAKVVTGAVSPENPVARVTAPAVTVAPDTLAVDAVVEMLDAGVDHVAVVDARGNVVGLVSAADLMGLETRSPFALRHAVLRARDEDELVAVSTRLRSLLLALLDSGAGPPVIGRVLSLQVDAFTARLIDLAIWRHGAAPVGWAWLALGSAARREFTLGSDQDNALAYAESDSPHEVDAYFERVARDVNAGLARCGFGPDSNDVLAASRLWRMSDAEWIGVFRDALESPDRSRLIRGTVAFDFRHTAGGLEIEQRLVAILRKAREYPDFVRRLARTATDYKPPLGFRGSLVVRRDGNGSGRLDLKRGGVIPVTNLARFYALTNGITISSTLDRLVAAEEVGGLDAETARALREASTIVARVRLQHHAAQIEAGLAPDNLIDPAALPPLARHELREAFRAIAHAQKKLGVYVPLGL